MSRWQGGILPYAPLSTPHALAEGLWWVDGPISRLRVGPLLLPFPTRMVIARLRSGGLWLWSPTAPTPALLEAVDALGPVEHLVSPNKVHYASIASWKARYPHATAWASPGVRARARRQRIDVTFDADLGDEAPEAWAGQLDQLVFRGSRWIEEVVFFHRDTSTLIVCDLVMALERERVRARWRWFYRMLGLLWPGHTPRELRPSFWGRKAQARACLDRMLAWQPERVVFAHGRYYRDDAATRLAKALAWLGPPGATPPG